jgi:hypothetical protein
VIDILHWLVVDGGLLGFILFVAGGTILWCATIYCVKFAYHFIKGPSQGWLEEYRREEAGSE